MIRRAGHFPVTGRLIDRYASFLIVASVYACRKLSVFKERFFLRCIRGEDMYIFRPFNRRPLTAQMIMVAEYDEHLDIRFL